MEIQSSETNTSREWRWWEDPVKLVKLETSYRVDASDEEACSNADITPDQLYYYQREINPDFQVKKKAWKMMPTLIARNTLVKGIGRDPDLALKYLERKVKNEFSLRQELTGRDGKDLPAPILGGVTIKESESNEQIQS